MVIRKALSFKALAHKAARLTNASQKAGLGAMMVATEIPVIRPTVAIASITVGTSGASIRKALKVTPFEREMMVGGGLSLSELDNGWFDLPVENVDSEAIGPEAHIVTAEHPIPSAEQVLAHEKALFPSPRMTVDDLFEAYAKMSPAEQIAFGRAIGVERVWLPHQKRKR
jgi:hypothetical protein